MEQDLINKGFWLLAKFWQFGLYLDCQLYHSAAEVLLDTVSQGVNGFTHFAPMEDEDMGRDGPKMHKNVSFYKYKLL